ncbi:MAG: hypothetical protein KUG83_08640 [Gammaproteobacteria bacterium]|nr:hypothetical protein [Gammaproteobacteria bacterium]
MGRKCGFALFLIGLAFIVDDESGYVHALDGDPTKPDYMRAKGNGGYSNKAALRRSDFKLSMILIENDIRLAMINNKIGSVNTRVSGAKILKIEVNRVVLLVDGERMVLDLIKGIGNK